MVVLKSAIKNASPKEQEKIIDTIKALKAKALKIVKKEAEKTALKVIKKASKAKIPEIVKKQKIMAKIHKKWTKAKLNVVNKKLSKAKTPLGKAVLTKKKESLEKKLGNIDNTIDKLNIPNVVKKLDYISNKLNKRSQAVTALAQDSRLLHASMIELD